MIHETTGSVSGAPVTTTVTETVSPGLLRSHIDERITRIRPASTPLDQISRMAGSRHSGSMKVEYYTVDMKPGEVIVSTGSSAGAPGPVTVKVSTSGILSRSETVLVDGVIVDDTEAKQPSTLICYVKEVSGKNVTLVPVTAIDNMPAIPQHTRLVRMGRAAGELDVQTPQYTSLPRKSHNYCQIFKAQIEESTLQRLSDKEVGWSFADQEEVAVTDMRLGMEKSFLFGSRNRVDIDDEGEEVYFTAGIWNQTENDFTYPENLQMSDLLSLMKKAFTGGTGSRRKVLVAGSDLIEALSRLDYNKVIQAGDKETVWGVDFDKIVSKFGTLYVIHDEVFDMCGKPDAGMIIDPEYLTKYSHIPFRAENISFSKQGVRNTEATVLTEASCLVLRYPQAHMRLIKG